MILLPTIKIFSKVKWKPCAFWVAPKKLPCCHWEKNPTNLGLPWMPKGPDSLEQQQASAAELLAYSHQQTRQRETTSAKTIYQCFCATLLFNLKHEVKERMSRGSEPYSLGMEVLSHLRESSYTGCNSLELFLWHLFPALQSWEKLQVETPGEI